MRQVYRERHSGVSSEPHSAKHYAGILAPFAVSCLRAFILKRIERSKDHEALIDWLVEIQPISVWTLGFHYLNDRFLDERAILLAIKRDVSRMALGVDEQVHRTSFVTTRVPRSLRFEGICFPEKLCGAGHVHILTVPNEDQRVDPSKREDFLLWQLQHLVTTASKLDPVDLDLLKRFGKHVDADSRNHIVKSIAPQATSHVVSVRDARGAAEYVTKEFEWHRSALERFFTLGEFHSSRQRVA